jgi:hypothetical protein
MEGRDCTNDTGIKWYKVTRPKGVKIDLNRHPA